MAAVEAAAAEAKPTTGEVSRHPLQHRCVGVCTFRLFAVQSSVDVVFAKYTCI